MPCLRKRLAAVEIGRCPSIIMTVVVRRQQDCIVVWTGIHRELDVMGHVLPSCVATRLRGVVTLVIVVPVRIMFHSSGRRHRQKCVGLACASHLRVAIQRRRKQDECNQCDACNNTEDSYYIGRTAVVVGCLRLTAYCRWCGSVVCTCWFHNRRGG